MLARLWRRPFDSPDYLFELKWDGIRAIALVEDGSYTLQDRNGHDLTEVFPELSRLPSQVGAHRVILDGEIVCLDTSGHPNFTLLEQRLAKPSRSASRRHQARYVAFDVLYLNNRSVMDESLVTRKNLLHTLLEPGESVQATDCIDTYGKTFFAATCEHSLEGIVAKLKASRYQPGTRSNAWLKIKRVRQGEFVIGGYIFDGNRKEPLKSLILGLYENNHLKYVGQVSSGLASQSKRVASVLQPLHSDESPFEHTPTIRRFSFWCHPETVCQVEYGEFTKGARVAYPVFKGLNEDIAPHECLATETPGWPRQFASLP